MKISQLKSTVRAQLTEAGLDDNAASSIFYSLGGGRTDYDPRSGTHTPAKPTAAERASWVQVSEVYAKLFTAEGRDEWKQLTGIELGRSANIYPREYGSAETLLTLRNRLASERDALDSEFRVRRKKDGSVDISSVHVAAPETIAKLRKLEATARRNRDWCGWWKVTSPGRGWSFNKLELAARCYELLKAQGVRNVGVETRTSHPDPGYRNMFNQRGPFYE